jgi:hypothetical protein
MIRRFESEQEETIAKQVSEIEHLKSEKRRSGDDMKGGIDANEMLKAEVAKLKDDAIYWKSPAELFPVPDQRQKSLREWPTCDLRLRTFRVLFE